MSDPIRTFENLKSAYLRYFDSPYDLRFEELVRARGRLLDRDGVLYREPLIEPQPAYASTGEHVGDAARSVLAGRAAWPANVVGDVTGFAEAGLFLPRGGTPFELYTHQVEMLRSSTAHGNDAVILTGTGSGKTEAIYLPVLAALTRESVAWPHLPPAPRNVPQIEVYLTIGTFALFLLFYLIASRLIPLVPVWEVQEGQMAHSLRKVGKTHVPSISEFE